MYRLYSIQYICMVVHHMCVCLLLTYIRKSRSSVVNKGTPYTGSPVVDADNLSSVIVKI